MTRKAFDFSNWTRVPTPQDCSDLKYLGYTTGIVGASFNVSLARLQIESLIQGGFRVEVYCWLRHPWREDLLNNALIASEGFKVERFWLDVEDAEDAIGKTPDQLAFDVQIALTWLRARLTIPIGIYTGSWFWDAYMETINTFGCTLWLANYIDGPPNVDEVTKTGWIYQQLPGGWTADTLAIWQWRNNLKPGSDFNADDNLILIEGATRMYTDAQLDTKFIALYLNAVQNGKDIMTQLAQIQALASALADHIQNHSGSFSEAQQAQMDKIEMEIDQLKSDLEERFKAVAEVFNA